MKKTTLLRCLALLLSLGIMAMSLIGCEGQAGAAGEPGPAGGPGPAGPAGINGGTIPVFMQGTWKNSDGTITYVFTTDKHTYTNGDRSYSGIYHTFTARLNNNATTKDEYPSGYYTEYIAVEGTGSYSSYTNTLRTAGFYFNADRTKFAVGPTVYTKQ